MTAAEKLDRAWAMALAARSDVVTAERVLHHRQLTFRDRLEDLQNALKENGSVSTDPVLLVLDGLRRV